jgi:hypothetical protein
VAGGSGRPGHTGRERRRTGPRASSLVRFADGPVRASVGVRRVSSAGELAGRHRGHQAPAVRRRALLGPPDTQLGRSGSLAADRRAGTRRARRQPHRPDLYRRPQRRLLVRLALPMRAGGSAAECPCGRRAAAHRRADGGHRRVRAARQQANPRGARRLRTLAGTGAAVDVFEPEGDRVSRRFRLAGGVAEHGGRRTPDAEAPAGLHARG